MGHPFSSDDDVIAAAVAGPLNADAVYAYCRDHDRTFPEFSNAVSLTIARRFDQTLMSYEAADFAMNEIWGLMLDYVTRIEPGSGIWEPTYSVFCAFDAGECNRGDGSDPVEKFTKPAVRAILDNH